MSILQREDPFYYSEIIPTIVEQLKIYYDYNWDYSDIELLCGCSSTTTRKYINGSTTQIRSSTWDILHTFPLPHNRFYTPWLADNVIFIATPRGIEELKPEPAVAEAQAPKQSKPLLQQSDGLLYKQIDLAKIPERPGIYMLANIATPLYNLSKQHFLIKVGMSATNLRNRVKAYPGMNPLAFVVDYKTTIDGSDASALEKNWHSLLAKKAICNVSSSEWFEMHFEDFKELIKKGLR